MQRALQRLVSCQATKRGARYSSTERPCIPNCSGTFYVKRMYGCAITCSETSSSFGVSQTGLSVGFEARLTADSAVFGVSIVNLVSLIVPPDQTSASGNNN